MVPSPLRGWLRLRGLGVPLVSCMGGVVRRVLGVFVGVRWWCPWACWLSARGVLKVSGRVGRLSTRPRSRVCGLLFMLLSIEGDEFFAG